MSIDEFDLRAGGTAEEIVERTWAEWEADGMEEQWLEQQDDLEGLDPHQCYDSWKVGWKSCAVATLEEHVERAKERRLDDEEYEREQQQNPSDLDSAMEHALKLVKVLSTHGLQAKTWGKPGVGVRVYVDAAKGYLVVSRGGDVSDRSRGAATLLESNLYPAQRSAYRAARDEYRRLQATGNPPELAAYEDTLRKRAGKRKAEWAETIIAQARGGTEAEAIEMISAALAQLPKKRVMTRASLRPPPPGWHRRPTPTTDQPCYPTKADALKAFLDANSDIVENYGGADYAQSPSEFDSINHKYGLKGKRAARSIADAVWYAMPMGKPYCLDRIDLDTLNGISAVVHGEAEFRLPDVSYESQLAAEEARHYAPAPELEEPSWVTEHRRFPALPPLPYRLQLEELEPGVATFSMHTDEEGEPMPEVPPMPPPRRPLTKPAEFKPYRLQRETSEPGVETYSINPAGKVKIKMTSTRSGKVGWIRSDGTPSDHESEAGFFTPGEAQATIAEYTENLVRVVGRCANRFEMLPTSNPPPGEHHRRAAASKGRPTMPLEAAELLRHLITSDGGSISGYSKDAVTWLQARGYIEAWRAGHWTATERGARELPLQASPKENPAWVTKILSKHFVKLEEEVPPRFLPKITKTAFSRGGRISATMKEYGCGAYGCVLPTLDPSVVLKLTTDDTEAEFANDLAGKLTKPVVVKYHMTRELPDKYKGRPSFLLWRDAADHVGQVEQTIAEESGIDPTVVEEAIGNQHLAAQAAYEALDEGEPAIELLQKWEDAAREMGLMVPELRELADGMITNLQKDKVFMGDVHSGNIGRVNGHWVVVDPGHIAVLTA
jgi:hypothetical protein